MSSFGNFVKKLRNEAGLSQEKLADKMDVSVNTIQNWESGNTRINPNSELGKWQYKDQSRQVWFIGAHFKCSKR